MNVIHASGTLKKFLEARSKGVSLEELKRLADEASREAIAPRAVGKRVNSSANVIYLPKRTD